ncbi:MAG: rhomboid family intramembrane serine protease [Nitrososphaerota archaeon]
MAFRDTPGVTSFRAHYFAISTFEYRNIAVLVKSTTKVGIVTIGSTPDEWIVTDGSHYVTKYARGKVVLKVHGPEPAVVEIRYNVVTDRGVKQERARFRVGDEGIIIADPDVYGFVKLSFVLIEGPGAIVEYDVIAFKPEQPPEKPPEQPPEPREPSEPRGPTNYPNIWDIIKDLLRRVLRDEEPVSIEPFVTKSLVALNTAIFLAVAANLEDAVMTWGLIPIAVLAGEWIRLLTHMYLHADYLQHLAGNMLFLYVFGDNVEERTTWRYVLYYHLFGLAAAGAFIMQALAQPEMMMVPAVGASGAIAGVLGYYFVTFPNAKVVFMGRTMPAWAFGSLWFLQQIALIFMSTNIAWSAHIGGFLAGVALAALDRRREARAD